VAVPVTHHRRRRFRRAVASLALVGLPRPAWALHPGGGEGLIGLLVIWIVTGIVVAYWVLDVWRERRRRRRPGPPPPPAAGN
jgi:hypothetical protein